MPPQRHAVKDFSQWAVIFCRANFSRHAGEGLWWRESAGQSAGMIFYLQRAKPTHEVKTEIWTLPVGQTGHHWPRGVRQNKRCRGHESHALHEANVSRIGQAETYAGTTSQGPGFEVRGPIAAECTNRMRILTAIRERLYCAISRTSGPLNNFAITSAP